MRHSSEIGGTFDFACNFDAYKRFGRAIDRKVDSVRKRVNGCHRIGKGHFIRLEDLRGKQRRVLLRMLRGAAVLATIGVGAAAVGISLLDGCMESAPQDQISSIRDAMSLRFNEEGLK